MDIECEVDSGCKTMGHCREHKPCCYCEEAKRVAELIKADWIKFSRKAD